MYEINRIRRIGRTFGSIFAFDSSIPIFNMMNRLIKEVARKGKEKIDQKIKEDSMKGNFVDFII